VAWAIDPHTHPSIALLRNRPVSSEAYVPLRHGEGAVVQSTRDDRVCVLEVPRPKAPAVGRRRRFDSVITSHVEEMRVVMNSVLERRTLVLNRHWQPWA